MGWWRRTEQAPRVGPEIIVADGPVLAEARRLLSDYHQVQMIRGTDDQVRAAVLAIARAGSLPGAPAHATSNQQFSVMAAQSVCEHGHTGTERPWHWLAAVAESAERRGDGELVASVALFAAYWLHVLSPKLTINDEMDMRLPKGVPDESRREIMAVARRVLPGMPPSHVLLCDAVDHTNSVSVAGVQALCEAA